MTRWKEGDCIRVVDRVPTTADAKSGLFYGHYRNVTGTIFKLYGTGETAQAAVEVDIETLPAEIVARHGETREALRQTLTGEAKRASASGGDNVFHLRYVILIGVGDLTRKLASARKAAS